jgi:NitT/TauT family transport system ATP-binding protein
MTGAPAKIVVDRVTMAFGDKPVTDEVSFEVRGHELLCIVGTSGGGKTTLLRGMAGLKAPARGAIRLDGEEITAPRPSIALIFQHFGLFPWKTVRRNVEYGLAVQGREIDPGQVERLIERIGLQGTANALPYQLSGGMQQRVGIARAFAVEPEVLLMDEPFSALDALTREELQRQLLGIWRQHPELTGVLVTHDIDEAILLGDRIAVLAGRPGHLEMEVDVAIPRPRDPAALRSHPEYPGLRQRLWEALREQPTNGRGGRRPEWEGVPA